MRTLLFISIFILSACSKTDSQQINKNENLQADGVKCRYSIIPKSTKIQWTAFKTPKKVGVKGLLPQYEINSPQNVSLESLLAQTEVKVFANTVDSNNAARDAKIVKYFFSNFENNKFNLSGKVRDLKTASTTSGSFNLDLNMNGKTIPTSMQYSVDLNLNILKIAGKIDVLNFALNKALAGINQACYQLHQGKTWSDVDILITSKLTKSCR